MRPRQAVVALLVFGLVGLGTSRAVASTLRVEHIEASPSGAVARFAKLEITFQVSGSVATRMQWPYDPAPPAGIEPGVGISVHAVFSDPDGRLYQQPAFRSEQFVDEIRDGRDWHLPTGSFAWKVRFSPNRAGTWTYRLVAVDGSGRAESPTYTFLVTASSAPGFVRVSASDARYFEFDDGSAFHGLGFAFPAHLDNPSTRGAAEYASLTEHGVNFVRVWISSLFGSAWNTWIGGRNQYRGYLPVTGLTPFHDTTTGQTALTMKLEYRVEGDTGWFDACRMQLWWEDQAESIRPHTTYRIRVHYRAVGLTGPRQPASPDYGLVVKLGGWHPDCYEPGTSTRVSGYGGNSETIDVIEGRWTSGSHNFLPRMYLGLENVRQGTAFIHSVSLREDLGGGELGPELMLRPSMEHQTYIPEERAYALDKVVAMAERHGVYLKLVVMEKEDKIYRKMADDGQWESDNVDGFYGVGRVVNKTRWLQQMWWRYLKARWGYSTAVHSWELTNEGDPASVAHYELADEFGKFMHCRVYGVEPGLGDGATCPGRHPNDQMVTTSFWHSFPGHEFWTNTKYPNVDYADVHAYVSTSFASRAERERMQWDAVEYHVWHGQHLASLSVGKPVVRGEAGLDAPTEQSETVLGLDRDATGVWLHNLLWGGLDSGGLYELYWWTSHIWNDTFDHRPAYATVRGFLSGIQLHKGGYVDWGGTVSHPDLRVVGQKNVTTGALHVWAQNRRHTWKNVIDGIPIPPVSAEIVVPGFAPVTPYWVERWDTRAGRVVSVERVETGLNGDLRLAVVALDTDLAFKIPDTAGGPDRPAGVRVVK